MKWRIWRWAGEQHRARWLNGIPLSPFLSFLPFFGVIMLGGVPRFLFLTNSSINATWETLSDRNDFNKAKVPHSSLPAWSYTQVKINPNKTWLGNNVNRYWIFSKDNKPEHFLPSLSLWPNLSSSRQHILKVFSPIPTSIELVVVVVGKQQINTSLPIPAHASSAVYVSLIVSSLYSVGQLSPLT